MTFFELYEAFKGHVIREAIFLVTCNAIPTILASCSGGVRHSQLSAMHRSFYPRNNFDC